MKVASFDHQVDSVGTATSKRAGASVTALVLGDGFANFTPGVSERRGSTTTYAHSGLKSMEARSGASQTVLADRQYDAFGQVVSSTGTWNGPFGYAGGFGYQEDGDYGLKLLGHRYYDSSTGRFLTRDPIKDGRNWYGYCGNEPTRAVDIAGYRIHYIGLTGQMGFLIGGSFGQGLYIDPDQGAFGLFGTPGYGFFGGADASLGGSYSFDPSGKSTRVSPPASYYAGGTSLLAPVGPLGVEGYLTDSGGFGGAGASVGFSPGAGLYLERRTTYSIEIYNATTGSNIWTTIQDLVKTMKFTLYFWE